MKPPAEDLPYNAGAPGEIPQKRSATRRVTAGSIARRKGKDPFAVVTAYDAPSARCAEASGIDVLLVGDSVGMVVLGYDSTIHVTMDDMLHHVGAVSRGSSRAHIVGDLPFGSYQASNADAVHAATRMIQAGAISVKLEGGAGSAGRIDAIVAAGVPVMAHIGLMPQTAGLGPGYKRRNDREALLADARAVQQAGAYAVVLELVEADIAAEITRTIGIPTIGIGSGPECDSQVLVLHDLLGLYPESPPFAKRYAAIGEDTIEALRRFADEVRTRRFPPP